MPNRKNTVVQWPEIMLHGLLFLIFFQLLSDFVEAIYAFGLLGTSIPAEIAYVLFFFAPLILLVLPGGISRWPLVVIGELMLICRIAEAMLDTRGKLIVAGLGVACFLVFYPSLLYLKSQAGDRSYSLNAGLGLTFGIALSILLRTFGSGYDVSTYGWSQAIGWVFVMIAGLLLFRFTTKRTLPGQNRSEQNDGGYRRLPAWKTILFCLGISNVFLFCYFIWTSPHVIARWTGVDHLVVVPVVALFLFGFSLLFQKKTHWLTRLKPAILLAWNTLFVLALTLTILAHQISFPPSVDAYPLVEPAVTWLHQVPLFFLLLLFPVILVDFVFFVHVLIDGKPSSRSIGAGFSVGSFYLFLMVFAQVFTTVYDYIPVVGPFFRDKFYLVFLAAGIVLILPVLFIGQSRPVAAETVSGKGDTSRRMAPVMLALTFVITVAGVILTGAKPAQSQQTPTPLKIITYNIQQGYNENGMKAFDQQLELFRSFDADIIGLQECDTARIAGGNADIVKYLADNLGMYSYYGPKVVTGTFGIALLSKYPIEDPQTVYLYSLGEQTALIDARITVGEKTWNIFVTHLGNGGPIIQQEDVMKVVNGKENVILMGDFNFRPDTAQYQLTTSTLADSWLLRWPQGNEGQGIDPARRIDHIFVSPDIRVIESTYLPGPQSDHPAMVTEIEW
ncbi:MAG: endonuclease/exonuclease/phosphatase family protein [Bacillota bacterium]|nr:endonuclease/exonuclease/phosphatase family protein [Bacillota bacterium]